MMNLVINWLPVVLAVIGGATVAAAAIAPMTKTKLDDKLAGVLSKIHRMLSKLALNPKS